MNQFPIPVVRTLEDLRALIQDWRRARCSVGLVPTMGYLHEGHLSLIKRAAADNDRTLVSVFVNPTQFGAGEDLDAYPQDLPRDVALAAEQGAAAVFAPTPEVMYPAGYSTYVTVEGVSAELCGRSRPVHFRGVATVCTKLFLLTGADRAYFGEKDAQQLAVIRRLVQDLAIPVQIIGCPIVREADGLAKSSRNVYLTEAERAKAPILHQALEEAREKILAGERDAATILDFLRTRISAEPLAEIDYIQAVHRDTIVPIDKLEGPVLIALAVRFGKARLIDNFSLEL